MMLLSGTSERKRDFKKMLKKRAKCFVEAEAQKTSFGRMKKSIAQNTVSTLTQQMMVKKLKQKMLKKRKALATEATECNRKCTKKPMQKHRQV